MDPHSDIWAERAGELDADDRTGFEAFRAGLTPFLAGARGWYTAHAMAYGEGVKARLAAAAAGAEPVAPYLQFSTLWEAWAQGCDDADRLQPGAGRIYTHRAARDGESWTIEPAE